MNKTGCIFWILAALALVFLLPGLVSIPFVTPILETSKDKAAAEKAQAQAQASLAQVEVIESQALANTLNAYTKAGVSAIETDRRTAHPSVWLAEMFFDMLPWLGLCCVLPCNLTMLVAALVLGRRFKRVRDE